jgi:hypothetical protein
VIKFKNTIAQNAYDHICELGHEETKKLRLIAVESPRPEYFTNILQIANFQLMIQTNALTTATEIESKLSSNLAEIAQSLNQGDN